MRILGVDPGIRHTGWCVLDDGKPVAHGLILVGGRGRLLVCEVLCVVIPSVRSLLKTYKPSAVVVEEVTWYGRARRAMLPLASIAGAIVGCASSSNICTYLLMASQRDRKRKWSVKWSEHERDAAALAQGLRNYLDVVNVGTALKRKQRFDMLMRRTIARATAP